MLSVSVVKFVLGLRLWVIILFCFIVIWCWWVIVWFSVLMF